jgi:single-strand DNA-binding protein
MNVLTFTAHLAKDAELRYTPKNDAVTSFSAAMNSGYGDKKVTTWVNCTLWGKQAESLAPYLKKGTQAAISGEVELREWTGKDGATGKSLELRVSSLTLIGGKPKDDGQAQNNNVPQSEEPEQEIPF